jgi:hypothetical protein
MFPQTSDVEVVAALKKLSSLERTFTACPIR